MDKPKIAGTAPIAVEVTAGKSYSWCSCGLSANQPYCDGAHKGETDLRPIRMTAEETKTVYLCACKHTKNPGFCDGAHKSL